MTQWRTRGFWSKAWSYALLALLMVLPGYSGDNLLDGGSSGRKRVFSHGFVMVCFVVAVLEMAALNRFYGARG